jgi:hypothetical protein
MDIGSHKYPKVLSGLKRGNIKWPRLDTTRRGHFIIGSKTCYLRLVVSNSPSTYYCKSQNNFVVSLSLAFTAS